MLTPFDIISNRQNLSQVKVYALKTRLPLLFHQTFGLPASESDIAPQYFVAQDYTLTVITDNAYLLSGQVTFSLGGRSGITRTVGGVDLHYDVDGLFIFSFQNFTDTFILDEEEDVMTFPIQILVMRPV